MKKNKLNLEKFRILELKNTYHIRGGDGDGDGDNGETGKNLKCVDKSKKFVLIKKEGEGEVGN
ncbi:hypothetical protein ACOSP6_01760 [Tenacibaculum sp. MEBiC06402]|uniref:hypothetical protein n=1 Tax=unclassified Tenacibaculum TaxID=2635139 RepID=UPI003B98E673